jgi:hypothetical protein
MNSPTEIKPASMASQIALSRSSLRMIAIDIQASGDGELRAEVDSLSAALERPNIVKLVDSGATDDGWPYLVRQL